MAQLLKNRFTTKYIKEFKVSNKRHLNLVLFPGVEITGVDISEYLTPIRRLIISHILKTPGHKLHRDQLECANITICFSVLQIYWILKKPHQYPYVFQVHAKFNKNLLVPFALCSLECNKMIMI